MNAVNTERYVNQSQRLLIRTVEFLGHNLLQPVTLQAIQDSTGANRDQVFRTLQTLAAAGWVEQQGEGWLLSPALTRLADRMRLKLGRIGQHYLVELTA